MNHLEQLVAEWLEFKGYFVRRNARVGKLARGGFEGELDVVAFHPKTKHVLHVEPSTYAGPWHKREAQFAKKFGVGKKYIRPELFPWLPRGTEIEQWAVFWASSKRHLQIGGGKFVSVQELYERIVKDVLALSKLTVIPEQFPLLRTVQGTIRWAIRKGLVL
jgi:hypothetical protein